MNKDLRLAKSLLEEEKLTCVAVFGDTVLKSTERGVAPLIKWLENGESLMDFHVADKVVGKGAAYLYVLLEIKSIHAVVLSDGAKEVLNRFNIKFSCDQNPKRILNRNKTGFCPIESAVMDKNDPHDALSAIKKRLEELK